MAMDSLFRYYVATVASIWFVTAVTLAAELFPPLKAFIATIFLHHWLGKSVLTLVMFGLVVIATPQRRCDERRWANYALLSVVTGGLLILGYFSFHYFMT
ncbi:hypothetical protein SAMN04487948_14810 [Halogranum amylolyticum]|uniref:Uncharacterized protein n=1 Tax=Halogranum amylolyticum TaxID=660520 RepID=A0A1H8WWE2_9EURY|nr:hypothetical protein [Halogranum amylolyticum]SEP31931.1 hypothetical protein SAMN04487948_14810 [Halogranum amylolyticum]